MCILKDDAVFELTMDERRRKTTTNVSDGMKLHMVPCTIHDWSSYSYFCGPAPYGSLQSYGKFAISYCTLLCCVVYFWGVQRRAPNNKQSTQPHTQTLIQPVSLDILASRRSVASVESPRVLLGSRIDVKFNVSRCPTQRRTRVCVRFNMCTRDTARETRHMMQTE